MTASLGSWIILLMWLLVIAFSIYVTNKTKAFAMLLIGFIAVPWAIFHTFNILDIWTTEQAIFYSRIAQAITALILMFSLAKMCLSMYKESDHDT